MVASLLDGKIVAEKIKGELKGRVARLKEAGVKPKLATILVGEDPASKTYLKAKHQACSEVGIESENFHLPADSEQPALTRLIQSLNENETVHGILLQLPLPKHLDAHSAIESITPEKDVDGLTSTNMGRLLHGKAKLAPCTPKGVMALLRFYQVPVKGKDVVVVNRSHLVGKPLAHLLLAEDATVTVCHSKSGSLEEHMREADILISAVGRRPAFVVTDRHVKEGAVVVDVAINRIEGKICGDVDFDAVFRKASWITPVPGGVGPMTVIMLLENTVLAAGG